MAYTTETKVRERAKVIASTPPSANIINYIAHAEAILKSESKVCSNRPTSIGNDS